MFWSVVKRLLGSLGCLILMGLGAAIAAGAVPRSALAHQAGNRSQVRSVKNLLLGVYDAIGEVGCGLVLIGMALIMLAWAWVSLAFEVGKWRRRFQPVHPVAQGRRRGRS